MVKPNAVTVKQINDIKSEDWILSTGEEDLKTPDAKTVVAPNKFTIT